MIVRLARWLSARLDAYLLKVARAERRPTGDGCDEWCSICGIRCHACGRP